MAELTRRASSSPAGDRDRPRPRPRPLRPPRPRPRPRCSRLAPPVSPPSSRRAGATVAALASLSAPETSEGSGRDGSDVPSRVTRRLLRTRVTGARGSSSGLDVDARHRTHRTLAATAAAGHAPRSIARRSDASDCSVPPSSSRSSGLSCGSGEGAPEKLCPTDDRAIPRRHRDGGPSDRADISRRGRCHTPCDAAIEGDPRHADDPFHRYARNAICR